MRKKIKIYFLFVLLLFSVNLFSQVDVNKTNNADYPRFYFNLLNFYSASDNQSRVDILVQVPYRNIRFIKEMDVFVASYEIGILISDYSNTVYDRSYNRNLEVTDFQTTISQQTYDLTQKSFNLKPGKYSIEIILTDNDSKKSYKIRKDMEIRSFTDEKIRMSDIMIISKVNEVDGRKMIIPNVSSNVGNLDDNFQIFFEIYSAKELEDSVTIHYSVIDKEEEVIGESTEKQLLNSKVTPIILTVNKKDFVFGNYKILVKVSSEKYKDLISKEIIGRNFMVRWQDLPISVNDLDLAIRQTSYIATAQEIEKINSGKDQKEKLDLFISFWKNKNPSLEEYFARVDYANEKFKAHRDGWKTDMGMVFIIFGAPDNIDRHPFELGSPPYEVWDYYMINRRFIFVDETGFGEYRLVNPIWDDTVRIR